MYAKLQFVDYFILEMEYSCNPFIEREPEITVKPEFDYDIKYKDDLSEALVSLNVKIGNKELDELPFYVFVKIGGVFHLIDSDMPDDEKINYYRVNALAILFPYLRSIVSDITSKGSDTPIILPTINIVALFNKLKEEKLNENDNK